MVIEGYASGVGEDLAFLSNVVAPEYFRTLTIGLLAGREFESRDDAAAPPVAIVNETLARRFWSGPERGHRAASPRRHRRMAHGDRRRP